MNLENLIAHNFYSHIVLNISTLCFQSLIENGKSKSGVIEWRRDDSTEARIQFKSYIQDEKNAYLHLNYYINDKDHHDYKIHLSRTPMHFGGYRYWFHCPETDKRVTKLYLDIEDGRFLSRHAFNILYPSQRQTDFDRALAMRDKYAEALDGLSFAKPKGMHHCTFMSLYSKYKRYNDKALELMARGLDKYERKTI